MQILLDCDGVLADFVTATKIAHDVPIDSPVTTWNYFEDWGLTAEQFWSKCRGFDFWDQLPIYEEAHWLFNELSKISEVTIVTAPSNDLEAIAGKLSWLKRHFNIDPPDVITGKKKWLLAHPRHVLIDDHWPTVMEFLFKGGGAVLYPRSWNEEHWGAGTPRGVLLAVKAFQAGMHPEKPPTR